MAQFETAKDRFEEALEALEAALDESQKDPPVPAWAAKELEALRVERTSLKAEIERLKAERKELIAVVNRIAGQIDKSMDGVRRQLEQG